MQSVRVPDNIVQLIDRGALFVSNDSGGKDSQAMFLTLREIVPPEQLVVAHAVLLEVEWEGSIEHIVGNIGSTELILAYPTKTFFDMVEHRGMFPSPKNRQCTSDLKRNPLEREIRRFIKARGLSGLVVNCMGMRAEESDARAKQQAFRYSEKNSKAGREWYEWLPIHDLTEVEVFAKIAAAEQEPFWTYAAGMKRKSCSFCIMACHSDLKVAARLRPDLYARYCETERRLGFTLSMSGKTLPEITGIAA